MMIMEALIARLLLVQGQWSASLKSHLGEQEKAPAALSIHNAILGFTVSKERSVLQRNRTGVEIIAKLQTNV
ncbi:MAG TPA: hypothetical protein VJH68_00165 [Candidatus Nanoarchaeia archaeon]|nr:hypothetical protein [Candidatus Nanoarchaeia archaeon]